MRLIGLRVIPIHYIVLVALALMALAVGIFAVTHGVDVQHFWHTAIFNRRAPLADDLQIFNRR